MRTDARVEDLLRELAPRVLGALVRRYGDFDACEDAVQEALLAAAVQWPDQGIPVNPAGWLIAVAARRMADHVRGEVARRRREEAAGLLALMLLTDARRPARTGPDGGLIPLAEQDRGRWDQGAIREGVALITAALARTPLGPYQLQAAIAAVHAEAARAEETDWPQILALYALLERVAPGPMVTLNRAVAVAMAQGPRAGLDLLTALDADGRLAGHHRLDAVRAHLLEMAGDAVPARASYRKAARGATSLPEQRYLESRAARLTGGNA